MLCRFHKSAASHFTTIFNPKTIQRSYNFDAVRKRGRLWQEIDEKYGAVEETIRVDHAGELGAVVICQGQKAVLKEDPVVNEILDQEKEHFATFERLIYERRVRPTIMRPIWTVAGVGLGLATASISREAAMACHKAVEEVITDHYNSQIRKFYQLKEKEMVEQKPTLEQDEFFSVTTNNLDSEEQELRQYLKKFRDEEMHHHDLAHNNKAEEAPLYTILYNLIKFGCKTAISISKKI